MIARTRREKRPGEWTERKKGEENKRCEQIGDCGIGGIQAVSVGESGRVNKGGYRRIRNMSATDDRIKRDKIMADRL